MMNSIAFLSKTAIATHMNTAEFCEMFLSTGLCCSCDDNSNGCVEVVLHKSK